MIQGLSTTAAAVTSTNYEKHFLTLFIPRNDGIKSRFFCKKKICNTSIRLGEKTPTVIIRKNIYSILIVG
jgi:hypothetical protein